MEREFGEIAIEIEKTGLSEAEEDRAIENPTVTVKQQQKKSKNASGFIATQKGGAVYQKSTKTVWNAQDTKTKKKKDIFTQ
jgi:hypothetical protein